MCIGGNAELSQAIRSDPTAECEDFAHQLDSDLQEQEWMNVNCEDQGYQWLSL